MTRRVIAPGRSCFECRRRKIKCDRSLPCSYCVKSKIRCEYPPLPSRHERHKSTPNNDILTADGSQEALENLRPKHLEVGSLDTSPSSANPHTHGSSFTPILPALTPSSNPSENVSTADAFPFSCFPFRSTHLPSLASLHPSSTSKLLLWQTYIDVVDPTLKILHIPTSQRRFIEAIQDTSTLDAPTECFMFAIYYAVVVTMPASECVSVLKQQKTDLLRQYRLGAEYAFLKANFLQSSDLLVLQALVVFLTFVRNSDSEPDMQTLTSLAVGNAMRMGLHCEEAAPHLSTFEVEMRRRLWWQVYVLDVRIAMECDVQPNIIEQAFNTKKPLNINDSALDPLADALPHDVTGKAEMTLTLIRVQTSELTLRIVFSDDFNKVNCYPTLSQAQKCDMIDELRSKIETKYLIYYSSQIPLDIIASATARLLFAKLKVMVCMPQASQGRGNPFRENYLALCLEVLKESHKVRCYKSGRPWSWLFETCVEWNALAYVMLDLCVAPASTNSVAAWSLVEDVYEEWKGDANLVEDRRWRHIETLWSEATTARRTAFDAQAPPSSQSFNSGASDSSSNSAAFLLINEQDDYGLTAETSTPSEPECFGLQNPGTFDAIPSVPCLQSDTPMSLSDLSGVGTACEWSASLFEEYWQITE